jgi:hypothetical protein
MAIGGLDVVVRFIGDSKSVRDEVDKVEKTGGKISTWAKGVGAAIGAAFVIKGVTDMITAASDLNETMSRTKTVFGESADAIIKWSEGSAEKLQLSQQAALDAVTSFQTLFTGVGIAADESVRMSEQMVQAAADLASFHNVAGGAEEVTRMLSAAMIGEYDSLQRLIPNINAAAVESEALELSGKASAEELTAADKAAGLYQLVLEGLGPAQGDVARTGGDLAGQQREMNAKWEDAKAKLGEALLPAMTAVTDFMNEKFIPAMQWLVDHDLAGPIVGLAAAMWGLNAALAANPVTLIVGGILILIGVLVLIGIEWDRVWKAISENPFIAGILLSISQMTLAIIGGVGVIQWLAREWDANWKWMSDAVKNAVDFIKPYWDGLKDTASTVTGWIVTAWNGVSDAFSAVVTSVSGSLNDMKQGWEDVKNAATDVYNWVKGKWDALAGAIESAVSAIDRAANSVADAIKAPINAAIRGLNRFRVPEFTVGKVEIAGREMFGGFTIGGWDPFNIRELAKGGIVTGPTLALVGEKGPEAVVPLGRGGMGNRYNITVNVPATSDPAATGRAVIDVIRAYERRNGDRWRTGT